MPSRSYDAAARQATGARNGRTRPANLREQIDPVACKAYDDAKRAAVCMFPTPTAQETKSERRMGGAEYIYTDSTGKPRRKTKSGSASFGLDKMAVTGMWPTPRGHECGDYCYSRGNHEKKILTLCGAVKQQPDLRKTPVCSDAANREFYTNSRGEPNLSAQVKLWPTPTAREHKGGRTPETLKRVGRRETNSLCDAITAALYATPQSRDYRTGSADRFEDANRSNNLNDQLGGQLNPDWVDWLVGLSSGYTDVERDMPIPQYDERHFDAEPEGVPRVATGIKNRVPRLTGVGNIAVPQQFYPVFAAIAEIERAAQTEFEKCDPKLG